MSDVTRSSPRLFTSRRLRVRPFLPHRTLVAPHIKTSRHIAVRLAPSPPSLHTRLSLPAAVLHAASSISNLSNSAPCFFETDEEPPEPHP